MEGRDSIDYLNSSLCDELLAEILCKAHDNDPLNRQSISLVCRRWLRVRRSATWKLGLCVPDNPTCAAFFRAAVPPLLAQHPFITCLSVKSKWMVLVPEPLVAHIVTAIAASCKSLRQLHFTAGPIDAHGLEQLSKGCPYLSYLELVQPSMVNCLPSLCSLTSLRELSLCGHDKDAIYTRDEDVQMQTDDRYDALDFPHYGSLPISKLSLINMRSCASFDLRWLWHSCRKLQKLELWGCDGVGDTGAMAGFARALSSLQELKLYRCRSIAGEVMALASENASGLKALTVHDGAETEGLRRVLRQCKGLEQLDLRLPLDLSRDDLFHIGEQGKSLRSLRLHSCMAMGADIQALASTLNPGLEELFLVRCRAVSKDPGTLSSIGQSLMNLQSIDVSENEFLADKELAAMLAACVRVRHLNLWKCDRLTDKVADFIGRRCVHLESIDIRSCDAMSAQAVMSLVTGCACLERVAVEASKLSTAARRRAFARRIAFV